MFRESQTEAVKVITTLVIAPRLREIIEAEGGRLPGGAEYPIAQKVIEFLEEGTRNG